MENVDALLHKKNLGAFTEWCNTLRAMGYTNSYKVLNAKDYGIPQNRKRVFMVSTLHLGRMEFPDKKPLSLRLKDMLESDVPESFYLSKEKIEAYERHRIRQEKAGNGFGWKPIDPERERVAHTITTSPDRQVGNYIIEIPKSECQRESGIIIAGDLHQENRLEHHNRVYDPDGISPTLFTPHGCDQSPKIEVEACPVRIRYLTPRECLRLMGQRDGDIDKLMAAEPAKTVQYRLAGNSIVVDVLEEIFRGIYIGKTFIIPKHRQCSLEVFA